MPAHPQLGTATREIEASVFSALVSRLAAFDGETYPLHVGDTWLDPVSAARMENLSLGEDPDLHRYAPSHGWGPLRSALIERERETKGLEVEEANLLVTAGATSALHCALTAMLEPGEEVIVLAPYWPLIAGIVRACRGRPVLADLLPFFEDHGFEGDGFDRGAVVAAVAEHRSERTSALYLSSPNNPTGMVLPGALVESLAEWAASEGLWIVSDEVYEHYAFARDHTWCSGLAPERTVCSTSFSKSYGLAGARCGVLTGPSGLIGEATKVATHSFYCAPRTGQAAAMAALRQGDGWLEEARDAYRDIGTRAAEVLGVEPPQGGTFLFLDLEEAIRRRGQDATLRDFLEDCADHGLLIAPGPSFGDYPHHARFCFTCVEPDRTLRGARLLRRLMDEPHPRAGDSVHQP